MFFKIYFNYASTEQTVQNIFIFKIHNIFLHMRISIGLGGFLLIIHNSEIMANISSSILLSHALRNKDDKALKSLVIRVKEDFLIFKTVKELPVDDVLPFLKYVEEQMQQGQLDNLQDWLAWVQKIIQVHKEHLSTIPDLAEQIAKIMEWMEKRVHNMGKLLQLHGKLKFFIEEIPKERCNTQQKPQMTFSIDGAK